MASPRARRWVRGGAVALAVALLLYATFVAVVSWRSAESLVRPERSLSGEDPSSVGLAYENVSLRTSDGLRLAAWWIPDVAPAEERGVVVFLHGYGDAKSQALAVAPFLAEHGYDLLAFDFRAHGESDGELTTVGLVEVEDVRAAVRHVQEREDADAGRLALLGFSMGGAAALNAAAAMPEVDAIVVDSAFATLTNIASNSITHFTGLPKYPYGPLAVVFAGWIAGHDVGDNRPVDRAREVDAPVLVIHGLDDTIAFADADARAIHDAARVAELWLVPGASHVAAVEVAPDEYARRVLAFLDAHVRDA